MERQSAENETVRCSYCGGTTREDLVKMALWVGERLLVIEDVPANVCLSCGETYYDPVTQYRIERLKGRPFATEEADQVLEVPVFSLNRVEVPSPPQGSGDDVKSPVDYRQLFETG